MKKSFIYNCLPLLFAAMATFSFTACGGGDGDDTDYAAIAAMQGALSGGGITVTGEAIDLGLSVKWASCNVGATAPEEYGSHYAWGETEEYYNKGYIYYKNGSYIDIGNDISGTQYDVATVKWGGAWRMPTLDEIKELTDNCTWTWTTLNGVNGYRVTGPNGNGIFLPAAGCRRNDTSDLSSQGTSGYYWSSNNLGYNSYDAYFLNFDSFRHRYTYDRRHARRSVRPVCP